MHGRADLGVFPRPVILGDDDACAGGKPHEKTHQQIDQIAGGAAHGGQGFLAHEFTDDDRIGGVVQLLEERAQQNGKEEKKQLFPDHAFGDAVAAIVWRKTPLLHWNKLLIFGFRCFPDAGG